MKSSGVTITYHTTLVLTPLSVPHFFDTSSLKHWNMYLKALKESMKYNNRQTQAHTHRQTDRQTEQTDRHRHTHTHTVFLTHIGQLSTEAYIASSILERCISSLS